MVIVNEHSSNHSVQGRKTVRRIFDVDVNYQRVLSSKVLNVSLGAGEQGSASNKVIRVKKTVQTAEVDQCQGIFTTTTLEPVDDDDGDEVEMVSVHVRDEIEQSGHSLQIARRFLETAMCQR